METIANPKSITTNYIIKNVYIKFNCYNKQFQSAHPNTFGGIYPTKKKNLHHIIADTITRESGEHKENLSI